MAGNIEDTKVMVWPGISESTELWAWSSWCLDQNGTMRARSNLLDFRWSEKVETPLFSDLLFCDFESLEDCF